MAGIPVPDAVYNAATNGSKPTTQNGDVPMQSSPFMSSAPEPPASLEKPMRKSLYLLAREEDLKGKLAILFIGCTCSCNLILIWAEYANRRKS